MRITTVCLCVLLLPVSHAEAQQTDTTQFGIGPCYGWSPGDPSPIQAWVHYFVNRPDSQFTEEAVEQAVAVAMEHSGLVPDIVISPLSPSSDAPYLRIEAERYERFALRLEYAYVQRTGEDTFRVLCEGRSASGHADALSALLHLSHSVRDFLQCVREKVELKWPEETEVKCGPPK